MPSENQQLSHEQFNILPTGKLFIFNIADNKKILFNSSATLASFHKPIIQHSNFASKVFAAHIDYIEKRIKDRTEYRNSIGDLSLQNVHLPSIEAREGVE